MNKAIYKYAYMYKNIYFSHITKIEAKSIGGTNMKKGQVILRKNVYVLVMMSMVSKFDVANFKLRETKDIAG